MTTDKDLGLFFKPCLNFLFRKIKKIKKNQYVEFGFRSSGPQSLKPLV